MFLYSLMIYLFIGLFMLNSPAFAAKQAPSFSFSKDKGLQPLDSPSIEQAKKQSSEDKKPEQENEKTKSQASEQGKEKEAKEDQPPSEQIRPAENIQEENIPENSVSENFAPQTEEKDKTQNPLKSLWEDTSWFFEKRKTKHKIALVPIYSYNRTEFSRLGLRFLAYSSDKKGYYFAVSGSKYLFHPYSRFQATSIGNREGVFRSESSSVYDNHYQNHYSGLGMEAELSDPEKIHTHRFMLRHKIFYQPQNQNFYAGGGAEFFFRKERTEHKKGERHFDDELFLFFKAFSGYDSRDNWRNPKAGAFHELSFGCKSLFDYQNIYCQGNGDFRLYLSLFKNTDFDYILKNSILALRFFTGFSLFNSSPYSLAYSLGGQNVFQNLDSLRGFKKNRFRGDKIYFGQAEIRFPILGKYAGGALFTELGEVSTYEKSFKGFDGLVLDYGVGLRIGLPPNYDMKLRIDYGVGFDRQNKQNYDLIISCFHAF